MTTINDKPVTINKNNENISNDIYKSQLTEIDNSFFLIVNELKLSMPKHFMNPEIDAYKIKYTTNMQGLNETQSDLFLLKNNVEKDLLTYNNNIEQLNNQLNTLKKSNNQLKTKIKDFLLSDNASIGMLNDATELYNNHKYGNWLFIIGILFSISYYYKTKN